VRIGLVGYGFGGRVFHAPLIASAPGVEFAGVLTRNPERRRELAAAHPGVRTYSSLAELARDGAAAVTISTPLDTHVALVREAIGLGLAVVCDKPFAPDAATGRALVAEAERLGALLTVYQNRRWDSDFLTVRKLLADGALGEVTRFASRFERFSPGEEVPASGGGLLRDLGSHQVDQALQLFGPVASVYAETAGPDGAEHFFFAALTHRSGEVSHLTGDWVQGAPGPRFRVTGSTGSYVVDKTLEGQEPALIAGRTPASEGEAWGLEPVADHGRIERGPLVETVATERGRWDVYYPALAAAVRGRGPVPVDPRDAIAALEVLDAARVSAREGRVVLLG
jgi:predicted dehydrogenase